MGGTERSHIVQEDAGRNGALAILFGGRWEGRSARTFFRRVMGGTERSRIFSKGDGRNGTLAIFVGG